LHVHDLSKKSTFLNDALVQDEQIVSQEYNILEIGRKREIKWEIRWNSLFVDISCMHVGIDILENAAHEVGFKLIRETRNSGNLKSQFLIAPEGKDPLEEKLANAVAVMGNMTIITLDQLEKWKKDMNVKKLIPATRELNARSQFLQAWFNQRYPMDKSPFAPFQGMKFIVSVDYKWTVLISRLLHLGGGRIITESMTGSDSVVMRITMSENSSKSISISTLVNCIANKDPFPWSTAQVHSANASSEINPRRGLNIDSNSRSLADLLDLDSNSLGDMLESDFASFCVPAGSSASASTALPHPNHNSAPTASILEVQSQSLGASLPFRWGTSGTLEDLGLKAQVAKPIPATNIILPKKDLIEPSPQMRNAQKIELSDSLHAHVDSEVDEETVTANQLSQSAALVEAPPIPTAASVDTLEESISAQRGTTDWSSARNLVNVEYHSLVQPSEGSSSGYVCHFPSISLGPSSINALQLGINFKRFRKAQTVNRLPYIIRMGEPQDKTGHGLSSDFFGSAPERATMQTLLPYHPAPPSEIPPKAKRRRFATLDDEDEEDVQDILRSRPESVPNSQRNRTELFVGTFSNDINLTAEGRSDLNALAPSGSALQVIASGRPKRKRMLLLGDG
jgi:hypothetical protein